MPKKPKLAIFTTSQGHKSISETLIKTLESDFEIQVFSHDNFMFKYYIFLYRFFPSVTKTPFLIFQHPILRWLTSVFLDVQYRWSINRFLQRHQPSVVINVFWMFRPSLDALLKNSSIQYLTMVTDPWSVHPFVTSKVSSTNLAFDQRTAQAIYRDIKGATVTPIGWLVRDQFEARYDRVAVRRHLQLEPHTLTYLFTTGSEGTEKIFPIVSDLVLTPRPVQIVVACGNNTHLLHRINQLKKHLKSHIYLHAIPFTTQLHLYMQAADLVIGKAGPNSIFEAVACHTPFFATTHMAGQEDGNLDMIRELQLGYVEENGALASQLLMKIISQPQQLDQFAPHLKTLATYNRGAKARLRKILGL